MTDLINTTEQVQTQRRYEIDWLRSLAFILLIFYHIGMFYVADWGWHVKSAYQSSGLQNLMLMVNPWRMPLIFFLSGFALYLVESKITLTNLLRIRFTRLFIPLLFGMAVIVVPQAYFEAVQNHAYNGNFFVFWREYLNPNTELLVSMHHGPLGLITWNHLWYLAYLWHYTLLYAALKPLLKWLSASVETLTRFPLILLALFVLGLTTIEFFLEPLFPRTHALLDDWYNHARYFVIFVSGYTIAKSKRLYRHIVDRRWVWVGSALPLYLCSLLVHQDLLLNSSSAFLNFIRTAILVTNALCWMFALVALSGHYLTRRNGLLDYLNKAVLPWYILHQSVIIVIAMCLAQYSLGGAVEAISVVFGTFLVCAVLYWLIEMFGVTRFLFGLKPKTS